jgi:hypothetical protein
VNGPLKIAQIEAYKDQGKRFYIAKKLVEAKAQLTLEGGIDRMESYEFRLTVRKWWGRWDLNPRPPGFSRFRSRAGYHTMLDNGPKRRNRAAVPNSIFLLKS